MGQIQVPQPQVPIPVPVQPQSPEWKKSVFYNQGDKIEYKGNNYICLVSHLSHLGWLPDFTVGIVWDLQPQSQPQQSQQ